MRENFSIYHPVINFIYFVVMIAFSVIIMNPVFLLLSIICAVLYAVYLKGKQIIKFCFGIVLPMIILSIIINPIFNHRGMTPLFQLPGDFGAATLESFIYGLATGLMIGSVIMWFVSFNIIITSDKLTFLFGKVLPGSSLIFIMILRFIPRYKDQIKKISEAQRSIGMGINCGSPVNKIRNGSRILAIMFTWALENAIQTADSMRSRGYGLKDRTSFMAYRFTFADKMILGTMIVLAGGVICALVSGYMGAEFFPAVDFAFTKDGSGAVPYEHSKHLLFRDKSIDN